MEVTEQHQLKPPMELCVVLEEPVDTAEAVAEAVAQQPEEVKIGPETVELVEMEGLEEMAQKELCLFMIKEVYFGSYRRNAC